MTFPYPKDMHLYGERDFTFLGSHEMIQQFIFGSKERLGMGYKTCAMIYRDRKVLFFRSISDEAKYSRFYGEKCLADELYARELASRLHAMTDQIHAFLNTEGRFTSSNFKQFIQLYGDHFAYHIAVFWAGDYLATHTKEGAGHLLYTLFRDARAYNERAIPAIEDWLRGQGDIAYLTTDELERHLNGEPLDANHIANRKICAFIYFDSKTQLVAEGTQAQQESRELERIVFENNKALHEHDGTIQGLGVNKGKARGRAKVITDFDEFDKIAEGDILVVPMTRPHFNEQIKKAAAIVTDEGSMLCHAAILAREYNIPCVIGTEIGTKLIKTGDMVEVDAEHGVVTILDRRK